MLTMLAKNAALDVKKVRRDFPVLAKAEGNGSQAPSKRDQADARKPGKNQQPAAASGPAPTKRTTPPKNRPTSTARQAANRPGGSRSGSKKRNG